MRSCPAGNGLTGPAAAPTDWPGGPHPVVAVDESPEMLERIHGAETVLSRIEDLDLGRRFDAVLFASYLLNVPDLEWRRTLLAAGRRHVREDGCVLIQRHEPEWFDTAAPSSAGTPTCRKASSSTECAT
jgi:hypothetical protein